MNKPAPFDSANSGPIQELDRCFESLPRVMFRVTAVAWGIPTAIIWGNIGIVALAEGIDWLLKR
jgi:hypothetical protein